MVFASCIGKDLLEINLLSFRERSSTRVTGNTSDSAFKLANLEKSIISFFRVVMERNILYKRVHVETFPPTE